MEDDELHVGELPRDRDDVVGSVVGGVEADQGQALVRGEDLHAEVVGVLEHREPELWVGQREALPVRPPRGIDLEAGDSSRGRIDRHVVETGAEITEVRGDHVVHEEAGSTAVGELRDQLLGAHGVGEGHRRVGRSRVRHVGEQRHRGVTGEEDVVEIGRSVDTLELVGRGAVRGQHPEHELHGVRCLLSPRSARDDVMGVDVEHEFALAAQGVVTRREVRRRWHPKPSARSCRGVGGPARGAPRKVEDPQRQRHRGRRLQEPPPVDPRAPGRVVGGSQDGPSDRQVMRCRRRGEELSVRDRTGWDRERGGAVGLLAFRDRGAVTPRR